MDIDRERMAHNIAMTFAKLESENEDYERPESKFSRMFENYCMAYGYVMSQNSKTVQEFMDRGEAALL